MTEFELIRRFFTHRTPRTALGVGDDAALVRVSHGNELAVSADMLVSGRHFFADADPVKIGHKSLAVNLSDMAAMGATPRWATLALALPKVDERWVGAFARGFMSLAKQFKVDLIGGDTTRGPLTISVQIMGEVPAGKALRRDGARTGDDIWVSGSLGGAAMALDLVKRDRPLGRAQRREIDERLHAPAPRVSLGLALRAVANSAIDISDGLLADLGHICERSRVGATIEWEAIPAIPVVRSYAQTDRGARCLLAGGDDYELCFTASRTKRAAVMRAAAKTRVAVTLIGQVTRPVNARSPIVLRDSVGQPMKARVRGYDHFR